MTLGTRRHSSYFCAACGADVLVPAGGVPRRAQIARDGASVVVCADCDPSDETRLPPATISGRGYESPTYDDAEQAARIHRIATSTGSVAFDNQKNDRIAPNQARRERTEGWIFVRVARAPTKDRSTWLDAVEAIETLRAAPWFDELRYIGMSDDYVYFERPPEGVADYAISVNPTARRIAKDTRT